VRIAGDGRAATPESDEAAIIGHIVSFIDRKEREERVIQIWGFLSSST
jgi:hypothetical protein